jgi:hypothetical protein
MENGISNDRAWFARAKVFKTLAPVFYGSIKATLPTVQANYCTVVMGSNASTRSKGISTDASLCFELDGWFERRALKET